MKYRTKCPRCHREGTVEYNDPRTRVSCGECLWRDVNIVPLICTPVEEARDER